MECAADAHPSGEVGTVCHGSAADVVGRWGGTWRPLRWGAIVGGLGRKRKGSGGRDGKEKGDAEEGSVYVYVRGGGCAEDERGAKRLERDKRLEGVMREEAEKRRCK